MFLGGPQVSVFLLMQTHSLMGLLSVTLSDSDEDEIGDVYYDGILLS